MKIANRLDGQCRILLIELVDSRLGYEFSNRLLQCRDCHIRATRLLRKYVKRNIFTIVIHKNNTFLCLANQLSCERIGIVMLAFEKHFLRRKIAAIHRLENGIKSLLITLLVDDLPPFYDIKPRENRCYRRQCSAHS